VRHSPGRHSYLHGKVLEVPPLSVSRAINQEPKTSWVAATPPHPRRRAPTRPAHARNHVFPRAQGSPFHLPAIRRITVLRLPFTVRDASEIPAAFLPDVPAADSHSRRSRYREMRRRLREKRATLDGTNLTRNDTQARPRASRVITIKLDTALRSARAIARKPRSCGK